MSEKASPPLEVAVPWSLSHYIPLNGFHPLYRALFDHAPERVHLRTWDNVKLHRCFRRDRALRDTLLKLASSPMEEHRGRGDTAVARYWQHYQPADRILTALLPGDLEFHHTAPFPSLTRPFVFHCETFAPVFFPFAHQGTKFAFPERVKEHYRKLLAHPLCLGIWSHIPETIEAFKKFFSDPIITQKLFLSRIGLSADSVAMASSKKKPPLSIPRLLFINSAHQQPGNFFKRGGHLVLRFWKEFLANHGEGTLILRCRKPERKDLADHGVDVSFVQEQSGKSILWVEEYLFQYELNELFAHAHVLLIPSLSLHSAAILHAFAFGTIPVVTDTIGTDVYIKDNVTGIVLRGVRDALWSRDPETGIWTDDYNKPISALEESLISQMVDRIDGILNDGRLYELIRTNVISCARADFSGPAFADSFWRQVATVYERNGGLSQQYAGKIDHKMRKLDDCLLDRKPTEWRRVFESPPQPMPLVQAGRSLILELGGTVVQSLDHPMSAVHDFSTLNEHERSVVFAYRLEELGEEYLAALLGEGMSKKASKLLALLDEGDSRIVRSVARVLRPFPMLYRLASWGWERLRRAVQKKEAPPVGMFHDIELVRQGVFGYNVIRCDDRYYAILQSEGEFSLAKAENGGYSKCFSADSAEEVIEQITTDQHTKTADAVKNDSTT